MKTIWLVFFRVIIMIATQPSSYATELSLLGGFSADPVLFSAASGGFSVTSLRTKMSLDYGAFIKYSRSTKIEIESGLMMFPRHYAIVDQMGNRANSEFKNLIFPVMVRFTQYRPISVAGGFYYTMGKGQILTRLTYADESFNDSIQSEFGPESGIDKNGLGLITSIQIEFPWKHLLRIIVDGRYLMDISNRSANPAQTLRFNDLQILFGISIGVPMVEHPIPCYLTIDSQGCPFP